MTHCSINSLIIKSERLWSGCEEKALSAKKVVDVLISQYNDLCGKQILI